MGTTVLADSQFGIVKVLRPYQGFANISTTTVAGDPFIVPAIGAPVTFTVTDPTGFAVGDGIEIEGAGHYQITNISGNDFTVVDLLPGTYGNAPAGTNVPAGNVVTPAGSYQNIPSTVPIMFSEGGVPRDDLAGQPGYDPNLIRGLSVPFGSRVQLWLPQITSGSPVAYAWGLTWRLRNVYDYRVARKAYHYPKQAAGAPNTAAPPGERDRTVIPAAWQACIYNGGKPPAFPAGIVAQQSVTTEFYNTNVVFTALPLLPNGAKGVFQQGVTNPGALGIGDLASMPAFQTVDVQAIGDELMIGLYKVGIGEVWNFNGPDFQLKYLFGNGSGAVLPDNGVYVLTGSAP